MSRLNNNNIRATVIIFQWWIIKPSSSTTYTQYLPLKTELWREKKKAHTHGQVSGRATTHHRNALQRSGLGGGVLYSKTKHIMIAYAYSDAQGEGASCFQLEWSQKLETQATLWNPNHLRAQSFTLRRHHVWRVWNHKRSAGKCGVIQARTPSRFLPCV